MTRHILIDTDTASDDATAIMMALRWGDDVQVEAITVVNGNVPVDQGVANALYTAELCGSDVPVYRGADRPLVRRAVYAEWFHGADGMGNMHYPAARRAAAAQHAVQAIIDTVRAHPGIEIMTLGPLTNIALALAQAPEIVGSVSRCVVLGGAACTEGNVTPAAEYNIWVDPEAARLVFRSGLPIEMVGWEHSRGAAVITEDEMRAIRAFDTPLAQFVFDCNRVAVEAFRVQTGEIGLSVPDAVGMSVLLDPTIVTSQSRHYVEVETQSELTRGMTVVDRLGVTHDARNRLTWGDVLDAHAAPTVSVCWQLNLPRWKEMLYRVIR